MTPDYHDPALAASLRDAWAAVAPGFTLKVRLSDETPPADRPAALIELVSFVHRTLGDWHEQGQFDSPHAYAVIRPRWRDRPGGVQEGWDVIKVLGFEPPPMPPSGRYQLADVLKAEGN